MFWKRASASAPYHNFGEEISLLPRIDLLALSILCMAGALTIALLLG
jgi:hypothetical protein